MEIPKDKAVAFITGCHAEKIFCNIEDKNLLHVFYTELYRIVSELYKQGYTHYCGGMSEGIDLLAASAVLDFKDTHPDVRFVAVAPFWWQQERYSITGKNDYKTICSEADEFVILAEEFVGKDFYIQRNDYFVENCSAMVSYHDGQCDVMAYTHHRAEKAGIPIINIHERLFDYLANESEVKKMLQSYRSTESFSFCKEGIQLSPMDDEPVIIAFEEIATVENRADELYITLHNQMQLRTSLFMDYCEVWFPGMDESAEWQNVTECYAQIKKWLLPKQA